MRRIERQAHGAEAVPLDVERIVGVGDRRVGGRGLIPVGDAAGREIGIRAPVETEVLAERVGVFEMKADAALDIGVRDRERVIGALAEPCEGEVILAVDAVEERRPCALGVDDGIMVKRRLVNRFTEDTGLTNKARRITYDVVVTLTNNKTTTERVVFKEPTPLSRDEKISVKLLTPVEKEIGSLANPKEVTREEDGKLVWRVNLKPGEKREFPVKVSVEHPGDMAVTGLN